MATTKKTTVTKKPAAKKPAAKKSPTRVVAAKAATPRKKSAKKAEMKSFRIAREDRAFTDFRITRQTVYWVILVAFIIFVQLWILKLQVEVVTLLDAQQSTSQN